MGAKKRRHQPPPVGVLGLQFSENLMAIEGQSAEKQVSQKSDLCKSAQVRNNSCDFHV